MIYLSDVCYMKQPELTGYTSYGVRPKVQCKELYKTSRKYKKLLNKTSREHKKVPTRYCTRKRYLPGTVEDKPNAQKELTWTPTQNKPETRKRYLLYRRQDERTKGTYADKTIQKPKKVPRQGKPRTQKGTYTRQAGNTKDQRYLL